MKIVNKKIADLIEADYNPRVISEKQEEDLTKSLSKFGVVDPIIINKNKDRKNIIVGGHQRFKILKKLGKKTVPCLELDLTLEQERELNVRLNKSGGEFDIVMLKENFSDDELLKYGFEDFELGIFDMPDYSALDDEDVEGDMEGLESGVKKAIQVEFNDDEFEEAKRLHKELREKGVDLGQALLEVMRGADEKQFED